MAVLRVRDFDFFHWVDHLGILGTLFAIVIGVHRRLHGGSPPGRAQQITVDQGLGDEGTQGIAL